MAEIKTKKTDGSVEDFINAVDEARRDDCRKLLQIYEAATGEKPTLWGTSIIGYGMYHYKSTRSAQEGDWPLVGFSPRKQNLTLYFMNGFDSYTDELAQLGKCTTSKGCLYIKRLSDVDTDILKKMITDSAKQTKAANP